MTLRDAYEMGKDEGYSISNGLGTYAHLKPSDEFISEVLECEEIGRQFSPFEFTAREFNDSRDPDRTWEEYERGIAVGAKKAWRELNR